MTPLDAFWHASTNTPIPHEDECRLCAVPLDENTAQLLLVLDEVFRHIGIYPATVNTQPIPACCSLRHVQ